MDSNEHKIGFDKLVKLFEQTQNELQGQAARSVDIALVVRNWLFGWYIVEYENGGLERSDLYGKKLINRLSGALKKAGIKGMSPTNLRIFRKFYLAYEKIQQTVSVKSLTSQIGIAKTQLRTSGQFLSAMNEQSHIAQTVSEKLAGKFTLGWSHYVILLTIGTDSERGFYEIEAAQNSWSVRELKRQIESALYERLALSRDK
ncbi:MAG: DUF1016 domain-containing protein, partial [Proteobacteria bacterium]|nr:DUF1016 domain-containing protein [Pseudomonadota bacterium]